MGYNRKENGIPFCSKSKGKLLPRSYPIQCERKRESSFFSVLLVLMAHHMHNSPSALGFFAVGQFAVGQFAVGQFAVRKKNLTEPNLY